MNASKLAVVGLIAFTACPIAAKSTDENVTTQAGDAFGQSVGDEKLGLYSQDDVRGFSPIDAGNGRFEGLNFTFFDRVPQRISETNSVRVGVTAQGYPFPAPTGIVDFRLNGPADKRGTSLDIDRGQFGSITLVASGTLPLTDDLDIYAAAGKRHQIRHEGGTFENVSYGFIGRWQPWADVQVTGFIGSYRIWDDEAAPSIFPGGDYLPPKIKRAEIIGQPWSKRETNVKLYGVITKSTFGDWLFETGAFTSIRRVPANYADLFLAMRPDGTTPNRIMIVDGNNRDEGLSGEYRVTRTFATGRIDHSLIFSARGRHIRRQFGGVQRVSLGESSLLFADVRPEPEVTLGPEDLDRVRHTTLGLAYHMNWPGRGLFDLAIARASYRKEIDFADPTLTDFTIKDNPWIGSASGTVYVTRRLAFYGGYFRGFEDALTAPDVATNRSEAPPAIRTRQIDLGVRYGITPKLTLVAGVFTISKPYFNLDFSRRFRELGRITNRGIELSLAGTLSPGVSIVAGSLFLDPRISGAEVDAGRLGIRPVGSIKRRSFVSIDWRFQGGASPLSLDFKIESLSRRTANFSNGLSAPAYATFDLGGRYRFAIQDLKMLLRVQVTNVANKYGWTVNSSGSFQYIPPRILKTELIIDF